MKTLSRLLLLAAAALLAVASASAQSISGVWTYGNTAAPTANGTGVFVFLTNGAYFHAESENTADAAHGTDGMERGTYTWNSGTGAFSAFTSVNTNGEWGLSHDVPGTFDVSGDTAMGGDLTRVTGSTAIIGAWTYGDTLSPGNTGTGVVVFLDNGTYFQIESDNTADAAHGMDGIERGTYTWDTVTGAFTANTLVNTNGQWGFSDDVPATILVSGNTMDIGGFSLTRVSAVPEPSTYAVLAGLAMLGFVAWQRRKTT